MKLVSALAFRVNGILAARALYRLMDVSIVVCMERKDSITLETRRPEYPVDRWIPALVIGWYPPFKSIRIHELNVWSLLHCV